jgi:hypothetical protein
VSPGVKIFDNLIAVWKNHNNLNDDRNRIRQWNWKTEFERKELQVQVNINDNGLTVGIRNPEKVGLIVCHPSCGTKYLIVGEVSIVYMM